MTKDEFTKLWRRVMFCTRSFPTKGQEDEWLDANMETAWRGLRKFPLSEVEAAVDTYLNSADEARPELPGPGVIRSIILSDPYRNLKVFNHDPEPPKPPIDPEKERLWQEELAREMADLTAQIEARNGKK